MAKGAIPAHLIMKECAHPDFEAFVAVTRITEDNPPYIVTGFCADIRIRCCECEVPFEFIGIECGMSNEHPMKSADGSELRAPIKPAPEARRWEQPYATGNA